MLEKAKYLEMRGLKKYLILRYLVLHRESLGIEPVVKAFIRGSVTVGGSACAVKGMACPEII